MNPFRKLSASEQLVEHLRREIQRGALSGSLPGTKQLVRDLGVSSGAVEDALKRLEHEGLVASQGPRRRRLIFANATGGGNRGRLRVGVLLYDPANALGHNALMLNQELIKAGHEVVVAAKSMAELKWNVERIARMVDGMEVDAWAVFSGPRKVLEWFAQQAKPAIAIYGLAQQVPMASVTIQRAPAICELTRKLVALGHKRVVMLVREDRRVPQLGYMEQLLLDELEASGIPTGPYNVPQWTDTPEGLVKILDSLYAHTPPTAIIIGDNSLVHATQMQLARRGVVSPEHVSLCCIDFNDSLLWVRPQISHIEWDYRPVIRNAVRWVNRVAQGRPDQKRVQTKSVLREGDTLGPAPR